MKGLLGKISLILSKLVPAKFRGGKANNPVGPLKSTNKFSDQSKRFLFAVVFFLLGLVFLGRALDHLGIKLFKPTDHQEVSSHDNSKSASSNGSHDDDEEAKKAAAAAEEEKIKVHLVQYKPLTVQTLDDRSLLVTVALECKTETCAAYYNGRSALLTDELIKLVSVSYSKNLSTTEGKEDLKKRILKALKEGNQGEELLAVHFVDFLIQ